MEVWPKTLANVWTKAVAGVRARAMSRVRTRTVGRGLGPEQCLDSRTGQLLGLGPEQWIGLGSRQ